MKPRRTRSPSLAVRCSSPRRLLAGCGGGQRRRRDPGTSVVTSFYPLQYVAQRVAGDHADVDQPDPARPGAARPRADRPADRRGGRRRRGGLREGLPGRRRRRRRPERPRARRRRRRGRRPDRRRPALLARPDPAEQGRRGVRGAARATPTRSTPTTTPRNLAGAAGRPRRAGPLDVRAGLADCRIDTIVVSHDAFGYLGRRYGLDVVGINGLSPDAEPSPAHLRELQDLIREDGITTVFSEELASREFADSLAGDLGIEHRGARPDRGPERRDGRPGLPVPDAAQPRRPAEGERLLMSTPSCRSPTAPSSSAAARCCAASTSTVRRRRGARRPRRQRLRQVHAGPHDDGPGPHGAAARSRLFGTPLARLPRLAPRRLRAAAGHRRVRRTRLRARGGRLRPAVAAPPVRAAAARGPRRRRARDRRRSA